MCSKTLSIALLFRREHVLSKPLLVGVEFPWFVCDQALFCGIVVLQHFDSFLQTMNTEHLLQKKPSVQDVPRGEPTGSIRDWEATQRQPQRQARSNGLGREWHARLCGGQR